MKGITLKVMRVRARLSQRELGERLHFSQAMVSKLEREVLLPGKELVKTIKEVLKREESTS